MTTAEELKHIIKFRTIGILEALWLNTLASVPFERGYIIKKYKK